MADAEVAQDLGTDAVVTEVFLEAELEVGLNGVASAVLQRVGADFVGEADTAAFLVHVDDDALHALALELALRRGGLRTLTLGVELDPERLARALRALRPRAVVLTGRRASMDSLGRLVYAARRGDQAVEVFDYRGALPDTGHSTVARLGPGPLAARDRVLDALAAAEQSTARRTSAQAPQRPHAVKGA